MALGIGSADNTEIDELGIVPATCLACGARSKNINNPPRYLLVISHISDCSAPQLSIPKGDCQCPEHCGGFRAGQVSRDAFMPKWTSNTPYGFAQHKGYGTALHNAKARANCPCAIHRMTFRR